MTPYELFKKECEEEIAKQNNPVVWEKTFDWLDTISKFKYVYHFEWLGRPIIQHPADIVQFQEIIWKTKPDLIIETGIAHGGSLMFSASMLALLDMLDSSPAVHNRMVLGIDIEIRRHNRDAIEAHPLFNRIKLLEGDSVAENIVKNVRDYAKNFKSIMVCLDSNHTHNHVLQEIKLYSPLVSIGNYCIVFDTGIEDTSGDIYKDKPYGKGNNPKTAVYEFLKTHDEFVIDKDIQNKLLTTSAPDGYLKRLK